MAFVTRLGNQFQLNGQRYRFLGVNNYPLIHDSAVHSQASLDAFFAYCVRDGIKVVRTWCFDRTPYAGGGSGNVAGNFQYISGGAMSFREATFAQADLVLDRARAAGVRLSIVMSNGANEFTDDGSKQSYCRWNNTINGTSHGAYNYGDAFHTDTNIKARFKTVLATFANRVNTVNGRTWKDDDTIFCWELMNEARYRNESYAGDANSGTATSTFVLTLKGWYDEMADYLNNTIGVQQLISSGGAGQYYDYVRGDPVHNNSSYGLDFNLSHADADIDYADFHLYPYSDGSPYYMLSYGAALVDTTDAVTMTASDTTITVALTNHGFTTGQLLNVFDATQAGYATTFTVATVPNANSFTYTVGSAPAQGSASGYVRTVTLAGFTATLEEYADVAHTTLNKPVVCGEYGLVKGNTQTINPLNTYPRADNFLKLLKLVFYELDFDGFFIWHYTHLFDDNNFNIKPDGIHTGDNDNGNMNDDDQEVLRVMRDVAESIEGTVTNGRPTAAARVAATARTAATARAAATSRTAA